MTDTEDNSEFNLDEVFHQKYIPGMKYANFSDTEIDNMLINFENDRKKSDDLVPRRQVLRRRNKLLRVNKAFDADEPPSVDESDDDSDRDSSNVSVITLDSDQVESEVDNESVVFVDMEVIEDDRELEGSKEGSVDDRTGKCELILIRIFIRK